MVGIWQFFHLPGLCELAQTEKTEKTGTDRVVLEVVVEVVGGHLG